METGSFGWILLLIMLAIWGFVYLPPVSKTQLARLVREAGDNSKAQKIAGAVLEKRYVSYFSYERTLNRIKDVVADAQADSDIKSFQSRK